jgi:hypothetical protein
MKREAWLAEHVPKAPGLAINYSYDSDNADTALLLLGIAAHNPDRAEWGKDRAQLLLEFVAVHRTFLRRDGLGKAPVKPTKMTLGKIAGCAIRLGPRSAKLLVGEGIETCLSAMQNVTLAPFPVIDAARRMARSSR